MSHGYRLDPLGGQVLHHDCISMIVSRFTTFTENFCDLLLPSHQICPLEARLYRCVSASSPCDFGSQADVAISVFRKVCEFF